MQFCNVLVCPFVVYPDGLIQADFKPFFRRGLLQLLKLRLEYATKTFKAVVSGLMLCGPFQPLRCLDYQSKVLPILGCKLRGNFHSKIAAPTEKSKEECFRGDGNLRTIETGRETNAFIGNDLGTVVSEQER
jgi:hypothetical protein